MTDSVSFPDGGSCFSVFDSDGYGYGLTDGSGFGSSNYGPHNNGGSYGSADDDGYGDTFGYGSEGTGFGSGSGVDLAMVSLFTYNPYDILQEKNSDNRRR